MESEYRAIAWTITELEWVKNLLSELGIQVPNPMCLKSGNQGATFHASNPNCCSKLKHVVLDFKWVRERVETAIVQLLYTPGKDQRVDTLTKFLGSKAFMEQRANLVDILPQD